MFAPLASFFLHNWLPFAVAGGYLVGGYVLAKIARFVVRRVLGRAVARSRTTLDDRLVAVAERPAGTLVGLAAVYLAVDALRQLPGLAGITGLNWVFKVLFAVAVLVATLAVNGILQAVMDWYLHEVATRTQSAWDRDVLPALRRVLLVVLLFIAASIVLDHFGANITALVTTAGVASLAVALAAQETLANMIAGFTILVDRPFRLGDVIELSDGKIGEVLEIGLRSTKIKLFDGTALVIPNQDIAGSRLTNLALPDPRRAVRETIGVAYASDLRQVKAALLDVMANHPEVLADPAPAVYFTKFGDSALDMYIVCWVADYHDWFRVKDELLMAVLERFRAEGIEIPFPQRDVHLVSVSGPGSADS